MSQVTHLGSTVVFSHRNSMQADRPHLRPKITRKFIFTIDCFRSRCDLVVTKFTDGFAQLINLETKIEIERRIDFPGHVGHGRELLAYRSWDAKTSAREWRTEQRSSGVLEDWDPVAAPTSARRHVALNGFDCL